MVRPQQAIQIPMWVKYLVITLIALLFLKPDKIFSDLNVLKENDLKNAAACAKSYVDQCSGKGDTSACQRLAQCIVDPYSSSQQWLQMLRSRLGAQVLATPSQKAKEKAQN